MPPSRVLLYLLSLSTSPSFLLAAARESLASIEENIAKLRLAEAEDVGEAESNRLSILSNGEFMVKRERTYGEVKQNIRWALLENGGDTLITTMQGGDSNEEQAPNLDKRISVISVADFIEIEITTTGTNKSKEPRFMKDLGQKKYTILDLEAQEGVFRQDVSFLNPPPLHAPPLPQANT